MPDATIMAGTISLFINPSFTLSEDRRVEQFLKEHNSEERAMNSRVAEYDKDGNSVKQTTSMSAIARTDAAAGLLLRAGQELRSERGAIDLPRLSGRPY